MPAPYLTYYTGIAPRMLPFLVDRHVAVEQRFSESRALVYRRHQESGDRRRWIIIRDEADLVDWARRYAVAFHAHLRPGGPGAWFVLDIDARERPLAMAQLAACHAVAACAVAGLNVLVKFSGSNGFHLMWEMPNLRGIGPGGLWTLERALVDAMAAQVTRRLADVPAAAPLYAAVGSGPIITTNSQDAAATSGLLFDKHILKANVNIRVPFSIHPGSGLVALPIAAGALATFTPSAAAPEAAMDSPMFSMPTSPLERVRTALATWR